MRTGRQLNGTVATGVEKHALIDNLLRHSLVVPRRTLELFALALSIVLGVSFVPRRHAAFRVQRAVSLIPHFRRVGQSVENSLTLDIEAFVLWLSRLV